MATGGILDAPAVVADDDVAVFIGDVHRRGSGSPGILEDLDDLAPQRAGEQAAGLGQQAAVYGSAYRIPRFSSQ